MIGPKRKHELPLPSGVAKALRAIAVDAAASFRRRGGTCRTDHIERDVTRLYRTLARQGSAPATVTVFDRTYNVRTGRKCA